MGEEKYNASCGDLQRAGRVFSLVLEIEQVIPHFGFGNPAGRLVDMCGELPDGAEIHLLRALGEPGQLQILVHALTKSDAHERVLSKRREEKPSGNPLCLRHHCMSPKPRRSMKTSERLPCPQEESLQIFLPRQRLT